MAKASGKQASTAVAVLGKYHGGNGISNAKPALPVAGGGKPTQGFAVAWGKGMQVQHGNAGANAPVRVHLQGAANLTACGALNTASSPYLGMGGHVAYRTSAKVTCVPCRAHVASATKVAAKAPATTPASTATAPVAAPTAASAAA